MDNIKKIPTYDCLHIDEVGTQCKEKLLQPKGSYAPIGYCKKHRKLYSKDIVEIVLPDKIYRYKKHHLKDAEQLLSTLVADVRLDLHGVLDLTEYDFKLTDNPNTVICGISYMSNITATRVLAREEFLDRMKKGQISFGVLNFKRGTKSNNQEEKESFREPGSKAWVNNLISFGKYNKAVFIDDSNDHVKSVNSLNMPNLESILLTGGVEELTKVIIEFESDK
jgi:hypothetical protein